MNIRPHIIKPKAGPVNGSIRCLPPVYFIWIAILKYFFDAATPALKSFYIQESPGWNNNLLILFGPVLAFVLNMPVVTVIRYSLQEKKSTAGSPVVKKRDRPAVVMPGVVAYLFCSHTC